MTEERSFADLLQKAIRDFGDRTWASQAMTDHILSAHASALADKDAQIASMRRALEKYGDHRAGCLFAEKYPNLDISSCDCGLMGALSLSPERAGGEVELLRELEAEVREIGPYNYSRTNQILEKLDAIRKGGHDAR